MQIKIVFYGKEWLICINRCPLPNSPPFIGGGLLETLKLETLET